MAKIELVEKVVIVPEQPTPHKRMFLSNIDLSLVVYQDSASFFDPPSTQMSFNEICNKLYNALSKMLVQYDFMAGRLVPSSEETHRFEIDCNGAGMVVVAARTERKLSEFGVISAPNPELRELVVFLQEESGDQETDLKAMPLASLQLTQFGCGSLALASHYNHCTLDGFAIRDFEVNLAALTRGDDLIIVPNADRTLLRARNPPKISHPHFEYSKSTDTHNLFTLRGKSGTSVTQSVPENQIHVLHLSPQKISSLKKKALEDNTLKNTTTFQVVAAKIWKARSIAIRMEDDKVSTMLFPVDVRKRVVPELPDGFAGNALVPGFARSTVRELKELEDACHIRKVQEGLERLDDEYIKSGLDWLEENKGAPCMKDSFSLVAWWRLGLEEQLFAWGRLKCATTLAVKPGLVMLLPGPHDQGGLNICLDLSEDQMQEFSRIMLEI